MLHGSCILLHLSTRGGQAIGRGGFAFPGGKKKSNLQISNLLFNLGLSQKAFLCFFFSTEECEKLHDGSRKSETNLSFALGGQKILQLLKDTSCHGRRKRFLKHRSQ